jgi:hypothetical protein
MAALARPIAGALRARAIAASTARDGRPRVVDGALIGGAPGAAARLWDDARAIAPILGAAYAQEPMQVTRAAVSPQARARNDACVPPTHWVCDGLAELEAIAILVGCVRLGELDAAVADALDDWQTRGGDAVPRVPGLVPAIDEALGALCALCERGAAGDAALAVIAPILALTELMRSAEPADGPLPLGEAPLARTAAGLREVLGVYRAQLEALGAALDRAAGEGGDRIAVALGVAARAHQVAAVAGATAVWIDAGGGPVTAAQTRWRGAAALVEQAFAGTLAGVRRLVPLPP